jgi:hypothetical protein
VRGSATALAHDAQRGGFLAGRSDLAQPGLASVRGPDPVEPGGEAGDAAPPLLVELLQLPSCLVPQGRAGIGEDERGGLGPGCEPLGVIDGPAGRPLLPRVDERGRAATRGRNVTR